MVSIGLDFTSYRSRANGMHSSIRRAWQRRRYAANTVPGDIFLRHLCAVCAGLTTRPIRRHACRIVCAVAPAASSPICPRSTESNGELQIEQDTIWPHPCNFYLASLALSSLSYRCLFWQLLQWTLTGHSTQLYPMSHQALLLLRTFTNVHYSCPEYKYSEYSSCFLHRRRLAVEFTPQTMIPSN